MKLKCQNFGQLMRRTDSLEKTLMLGKTEGRRRSGRQGMRWLNGITNSMDMSLSKLQEMGSLACCSSWGHKESNATEQQQAPFRVLLKMKGQQNGLSICWAAGDLM